MHFVDLIVVVLHFFSSQMSNVVILYVRIAGLFLTSRSLSFLIPSPVTPVLLNSFTPLVFYPLALIMHNAKASLEQVTLLAAILSMGDWSPLITSLYRACVKFSGFLTGPTPLSSGHQW